MLLTIVSAVVLAAVVTGFLVLGTPGDARKETLDRKRIDDLSNLTNALRSYDQRPEGDSLPETLDDALLSSYWKTQGRDPETGQPYGYRKLAPGRFELCATFSTVVTEADLEDYRRGWAHPAGRACFEFTLRGGDLLGPIRAERGP
jgi:hypothetical protein